MCRMFLSSVLRLGSGMLFFVCVVCVWEGWVSGNSYTIQEMSGNWGKVILSLAVA